MNRYLVYLRAIHLLMGLLFFLASVFTIPNQGANYLILAAIYCVLCSVEFNTRYRK